MKKERLSDPYQLRLPRDVESQLRMIAKSCGKPMTAVMRECLVNAKPVFRARTPIAVQKDRTRALRYIYKAGNNLNQIAKSLNTLNAKDQLDYQSSIKYLYLLDTIEAQLSIILEQFNAD